MADDQRPTPARDLQAMWAQNEGRFRNSRKLIAECAEWELQRRPPRVPMRDNQPQGFPVQMPHQTIMPQDVASFVARRQPSIYRHPLGAGSRAQKAASTVEEWLQEAFKSKIKIDGEALWDTLCAFATHDGEYAVLVQPAPSHYSGLITLYDDDGGVRAEWNRNPEGLDLNEYLTKNGSRKGYRNSLRKSTEAQQSYARDYKARRWPFVVRVLSAAEYLPIGRDPLSGKLDTLVVRSVCSATHLRTQGFEWWASAHGGADESNVEGSGRTYWLYELHSSNPWRIVYQIVGLDGTLYQATKDGDPVQHGLDMAKLYSLNTLHAGVFYGWHRAHEKDPDKRGIPLLAPFLGIIGAANRSITGIVEHSYRTGYGGWGVKMEPELYETWVEMGRPQQFDLHDDAIHVLLGNPVSLVHQGVGEDAWRIMEFLQGLVERFNESEQVRSSPDASSIAQTTALASVDTILGQITAGALGGYQLVAEALLEQAAALSEQIGGPIPVYCHVNTAGEEQTHVEISTDDLMGDFMVEVEQPTKKGSNLPKAQAGVAWQERGLIGKYEWREDFYGDPQPEDAMDRIAAEQYLDSEQGQQELQTLVARIQGDREAQRIKQMQQSGDMTLGGTPSAMLPPRPAGQGLPQNGAAPVGPNGVPTSALQNGAAQSLGGQMAAALNPGAQTQVVAATGTGAETAMP